MAFATSVALHVIVLLSVIAVGLIEQDTLNVESGRAAAEQEYAYRRPLTVSQTSETGGEWVLLVARGDPIPGLQITTSNDTNEVALTIR